MRAISVLSFSLIVRLSFSLKVLDRVYCLRYNSFKSVAELAQRWSMAGNFVPSLKALAASRVPYSNHTSVN
jgi:hypothetical protein